MKTNQLLFIIALLVTSCVTAPDGVLDTPSPTVQNKPVQIDPKFELTTTYAVEVRDGYVTRVSYGDEILAFTDVAMTIDVPKAALATTRAGAVLLVEHIPYSELPEFEKGTGVSESANVLLFEDSRNADFDYNDLVLYIKHRLYVNKGQRVFDIFVKPIALGAAKEIKFGYMDADDKVAVYLSNDVRKDYFRGQAGMINTVISAGEYREAISTESNSIEILSNGTPQISLVTKNTREKPSGDPKLDIIRGGYFIYSSVPSQLSSSTTLNKKLNYFIEVDNGVRFFVSEIGAGTGGSLPYGISIPGSLNTYPQERQLIREVFPEFENWILNANQSVDWYLRDSGKGYPVNTSGLFRWYN